MNKHLRTVVIVFTPVLWLAAIIIALNITSPIIAGPAGILVVFSLFYFFVASVAYILLKLVGILWRLVGRGVLMRDRQMLYIAFVLAMGPIFLLALNTLGQIGIVEVALVALLVFLGCFYVVRRSIE